MYEEMAAELTADQLAEAYAWCADITWAELDLTPDDIAAVSAGQIVRVVDRHYDGGLDAFLADVA